MIMITPQIANYTHKKKQKNSPRSHLEATVGAMELPTRLMRTAAEPCSSLGGEGEPTSKASSA